MTDARGRIYIAGPMTGLPDHNFPAFHAAADRFLEAGWEVANPADNFGGRTDLPREIFLRLDVILLAQCDAIAMLPGWRRSRGALLEWAIARELRLDVYDAETMMLFASETVLDTALRITDGSRQADYGHPRDDFARTATMWTGILAGRLRDGAAIAAGDIPLCMIAVKLARQAHRHKRDNLVDIAGYARTASMVAGDE
jgi:hypothetical protein